MIAVDWRGRCGESGWLWNRCLLYLRRRNWLILGIVFQSLPVLRKRQSTLFVFQKRIAFFGSRFLGNNFFLFSFREVKIDLLEFLRRRIKHAQHVASVRVDQVLEQLNLFVALVAENLEQSVCEVDVVDLEQYLNQANKLFRDVLIIDGEVGFNFQQIEQLEGVHQLTDRVGFLQVREHIVDEFVNLV